MNLYAPISVYRAAFDNRGVAMPLAEFMNLGRTQYAKQITEYREKKKKLAECYDYRQVLEDNIAESEAKIQAEQNPLGGEDTPDVVNERLYQEKQQKELDSLIPDIEKLEEELKKQKTQFPCGTLSGYFEPTRARANLKIHSGLMCIDIDDHYFIDKKKYFQRLDTAVAVLQQHPNVLYASHSIGGVGYFALIPLGPIDDQHTHEWYFDCLKADFEELGIIIDPACRDTTRTRFISMDDNPFRNKNAQPYMGRADFESRNEIVKRRQEEQLQSRLADLHHQLLQRDPDLDRRHLARCIENLLRIRPAGFLDSYEDWTKVSVALATAFGESGRQFFHDMCSLYHEYEPSKYDKMYDNFVRTAAHQTTITEPMRVILAYFKQFNITFKY